MWHEKFGWKENPYDVRNLSETLIGEEAQEKQLIKFISNQSSALVFGSTGIGKTTLLKQLAKKINNGEIEDLKGVKVLYYRGDLDELKKFPSDLRKAKLFSFGTKKVAIFVDEAHFAKEEDLIRVSSAWDTKQVISVVYAQIKEYHKMAQVDRRIGIHKMRMRNINRGEIEELLKQRTGNVKIFSDDALRYVALNSHLNPSIALQHCASLADQFAKEGKSISLSQVKSGNMAGTPTISEEENISEIPEKIQKMKISPFQKQVLNELRLSPQTMAQLSETLKKPITTISTQLNRLSKAKHIVVVGSSHPRKYGLRVELKTELSSD